MNATASSADAALRAIEPHDRERIRAFLQRRWGSATIQLDGRAIDAAALPGFIARDGDGIAASRHRRRNEKAPRASGAPCSAR